VGKSDSPWWAGAVVYQVYPRSFADDNEDGNGDLPGLVGRLPYLEDLGVDAIWLSPFYPSPLNDGGYDVSDYMNVDPRFGTLDDFDRLVKVAKDHDIRIIVDIVPNHCSWEHPLFKKALAAPPGSPERDLFIFRDGRGPDGAEPPNNWPSRFGGRAWTRVPDGQWYLHLFDTSQPDWNWRDPRVGPMFEEILRFWLDRGIGGFRIDVAHGLFKDPDLADVADPTLTNRPSAYYHRPEVHAVYRDWRAILDSYPSDGFPGARTAIGEVWAESATTLAPYLAPGELPQVFNFELVKAAWSAPALRAAIDDTHAFTDGSRAPWVLGNHDVVRPVTRWGPDAARAAALLLLALPGSAYVYQGEELGLPEVDDIPDAARQDPTFRRTGGKEVGRDGCRVPLPWSAAGSSFGFSGTDRDFTSAPPWLPQPPWWGEYSVATQSGDPDSFLSLYQAALRIRRSHPALGTGGDGSTSMRWLASPDGALFFAREPGFLFAANLGASPVALPPHSEVLAISGELDAEGELPPNTAAWLARLQLASRYDGYWHPGITGKRVTSNLRSVKVASGEARWVRFGYRARG
jgi:alpha-glucosidase